MPKLSTAGFRVVSPADLSAAEIEEWRAWQEADPLLAGPFFRPEFTQAVADFRDDTHVAIGEADGERIGYFPFHRGAKGCGRPVGDQLSDYHTIIMRPGARLDGRALVRACGLRQWEFDHLPAGQGIFDMYQRVATFSPVIDLAEGDQYFREYCHPNSQPQRKRRRIERDLGAYEFTWHSTSAADLQRMMEWKSKQYLESGKRDNFSIAWVRGVVEKIHQMPGDAFGAVLSTLTVKGQLVAAHLGMRSGPVLHYWFPAYEPEFGRYSPGAVLLLLMTERAREYGVRIIDLGKGRAEYKEQLANRQIPLIEGIVPAGIFSALAARTAHRGKRVLRSCRDFIRDCRSN